MVLSGACLSLLGRSGTGKTHLARSITRFFKTMTAIYIEPGTGAHLSRRGGFIGWRKVVDHLRDGDYGIIDAVCNDWFVALDDIGAERASDFQFPSSIKSSMRGWVNGLSSRATLVVRKLRNTWMSA
jgi:hypothetical protein